MTNKTIFSIDGELLSPPWHDLESERERERTWFAPDGPQELFNQGLVTQDDLRDFEKGVIDLSGLAERAAQVSTPPSIGRGDCEGCSTPADLFDGYVNGYGEVKVCLPCMTRIDADNSAEYQREHDAEMGIERYYESRFDDGSRLDEGFDF